MSDYGYICPLCSEPILEKDATEHTAAGVCHLRCTDAKATPREKKIQKMHPKEVRLGLCANCHQRMVLSDGTCMQCGHGPRIGA
jgi:hypothetical protein